MSQQQEVVAKRLISVIQNTQLGRKTGLLTVRRGVGKTQEEGSLMFVNGQVTQAKVGRRVGSDALNWLSTWGTCLYTFTDTDTSMPKQVLPATPPPNKTGTHTSPLRITMPPLPAPPTSRQTNPYAPKENTTGDLESRPIPDPLAFIPYHTRQLESALRMIEHMSLSRIHWRLFLLIDGQRSVQELIRLMGRPQNDVIQLLQDLEHATIIQVPQR